jgi:hypothetical protein
MDMDELDLLKATPKDKSHSKNNNVVNPIINLPCGDGLYQP